MKYIKINFQNQEIVNNKDKRITNEIKTRKL